MNDESPDLKDKIKKDLSNGWEKVKKKGYLKARTFFTHKPKKSEHSYLKQFGILLVLLFIVLTALYINRSESYSKYERVMFKSSGSTLYANLYYPSKSLEFQEKLPLIIYTHGIGSKRDFDLRIPIEFTKRGFIVVALDYQGHGESGGNINKIDETTNIPALAQDCSKLLDKLETLPFYTEVNTSQIGLIGHSLGGMVALMNQALDSRFNITVAWAPLVNFEPPLYGFKENAHLSKYIPVNLLNETNTHNLLIIMHTIDGILDFNESALKAQQLTNCTVIPITEPLIGGGHQLFSNTVLIESINWFEQHFFNSETINGNITITFMWNYFLIILTLIILITFILLLTIFTSGYFTKDILTENQKELKEEVLFNKLEKRKKIFLLLLFSGIFIANWLVFAKVFGMVGILYASILFSCSFIIIKIIIHVIKHRKHKSELPSDKFRLKHFIKREFKLKYILFALISAFYFMGIYILFSYSYPFAFVWPSNISQFIISGFLFPVYLSIEILFRKVLYPQLNYLKSESSKTNVILLFAFIIFLILSYTTIGISYLPSVIFTYIMFLIVSVLNTFIYERTKGFSFVLLTSFDLLQLFLAAAISNLIGVGLFQ